MLRKVMRAPAGKQRVSEARTVLQFAPDLADAVLAGTYPAVIQKWIEGRGGAEKMPHEGVWSLGAEELWAMGYRRCRD
jgi:hypothetical protein